jgi:hypothetical protein
VTRCMGCFCSGLELGLTFTAVVSHERWTLFLRTKRETMYLSGDHRPHGWAPDEPELIAENRSK